MISSGIPPFLHSAVFFLNQPVIPVIKKYYYSILRKSWIFKSYCIFYELLGDFFMESLDNLLEKNPGGLSGLISTKISGEVSGRFSAALVRENCREIN